MDLFKPHGNYKMKRWIMMTVMAYCMAPVAHAEDKNLQTITKYITKGKTLPAKFCKEYPFRDNPKKNDTGINVLIDQAHQTSFVVLWGMRGAVSKEGFRTCTSIACLDTVLDPTGKSRVRLKVDKLEPYAWWPNAEYNVIITSQQDMRAQQYTEKERKALKQFVTNGGGLLIMGGTVPKSGKAAEEWSLNQLCADYGAAFTETSERKGKKRYSALELSGEWETLKEGDTGKPIRARRKMGKGRVMIFEHPGALATDKKKVDPEIAKANLTTLVESITWLAEGKPPVRGDGLLPHIGGVGIFPENQAQLGGIDVYYAGNQPPEVMNCINTQIPEAAQKIRGWLPSKIFDEPYAIVMAAGGGGGWAINPRPKAAAVITYKPLGLLGVFAHEMAHTMGGPRNALDELAARSPHTNQGESHAGWFQGKILALYDPARQNQSNRNCNSILKLEAKAGKKLDVANYSREEWGKGPDWTKHWYIFQKMDDRYGPTWYPRWYWVRTTRWQNDPGHKETWDEMVEDMSIAVGEDLFPFFRSIGTTLEKKRLEQIEFQGKVMKLSIAPIDNGPAGNVCLDPIGDFTQPLQRK